jgi:hypothetical protein
MRQIYVQSFWHFEMFSWVLGAYAPKFKSDLLLLVTKQCTFILYVWFQANDAINSTEPLHTPSSVILATLEAIREMLQTDKLLRAYGKLILSECLFHAFLELPMEWNFFILCYNTTRQNYCSYVLFSIYYLLVDVTTKNTSCCVHNIV